MQIEYRAEKNPSGVLPLERLKQIVQNHSTLSVPGTKETELIKVRAVIITYNEEIIISKTLSQLWWCDEIIVIDSGSSDKTVSICEEFGCTVFTRNFKGFGEQKNYGVSKAKNEWILCIDADEVLSEELVDELRSELSVDQMAYSAFDIPLNLVFINKIFKYGKESSASALRLFDKTQGSWDGAIVHERLQINGAVKKLKNKIFHYSYQDYGHFLHKINLYSTLGAKKLLEKNRSKSTIVNVLSIPFNFFKYYIIERNFLNGYKGFAWSAFNTFYHYVKYLKLRELRKGDKITKRTRV